jgi:hypothetical protein
MKKLLSITTFAFILTAFGSANATYNGYNKPDPIMKKNIQIKQSNYGNVRAKANVNNVYQSNVRGGAAGNTLTAKGNVKNLSFYGSSKGNISLNMNAANIASSTVDINAAGNAVTLN